jgi:dTDP-4-dehydrorhamnose reductase
VSAPVWADRPVVVLGAKGMLGRDLVSILRERLDDAAGDRVVAWDKDELDMTCSGAIVETLGRIAPGVVINCAAYTNVDGCESNVDEAMAINAVAPALLGEACRSVGALLVHISTDFIFDGRSRRPYRPDDAANPLSVYGRSKWEGEEAVHASGCRSLIVRTSWLYGVHGRNFVEAILQKAKTGESLRVVDDQVGRPTFTVDLSDALVRLLDVGAEGVVHFANDGECSWNVFAKAIVELAGLNTSVAAISSGELDRPAKRPAYSVLDLSNYQKLTNHAPRSWREALAEYMVRREVNEATQPLQTS